MENIYKQSLDVDNSDFNSLKQLLLPFTYRLKKSRMHYDSLGGNTF